MSKESKVSDYMTDKKFKEFLKVCEYAQNNILNDLVWVGGETPEYKNRSFELDNMGYLIAVVKDETGIYASLNLTGTEKGKEEKDSSLRQTMAAMVAKFFGVDPNKFEVEDLGSSFRIVYTLGVFRKESEPIH